MIHGDRPRALIVGAGIGGLAGAIALRAAGFDVLVVERAAELRDVGFALLLAPNAMRALRRLGVAETVARQGEVGAEGQIRAADGRVLKRVNLAGVREATGEDTVCALRHVVHGALLEALTGPGVETRTGACAQSFTQSSEGVELTLEDGERLAGAILVGADGVHSTVRAALHADALRPSGLVAYRGVCHSTRFSVTGAQYFGSGIECGVANAGGDAVYWYVSAQLSPVHEAVEPKRAVLETLGAFDPEFLDLVQRTEPAALRRDVLFDRAPLRRWGSGRVTLLGDAAHPMLPHAGQGAAQALEDAVVLGRCIEAGGDLEAGLRGYEQLRRRRTRRIVATARRNAWIGSLRGPRVCALRERFMRYAPASMIEKQLLALARVNL